MIEVLQLIGGTHHGEFIPYRGDEISLFKYDPSPPPPSSLKEASPIQDDLPPTEIYEYKLFTPSYSKQSSGFYVLKGLPEYIATSLVKSIYTSGI